MRTLCLTLLLIVLCPLTAESQNTPEWQHLYEQLCDCDDIDSGNAEELHELLQELADSPVNLYDATPEDIDRLLFLSTEQRAELNQYISRHGHMLSMGETRMLRTIDPLRLQLLDFFAYVKAEERLNNDFPSLRDMAKYGKTTIASSIKLPLYNRAGDRDGYCGYKYKHWTRLTHRLGNHMQIGLTATQDAGEPFFAGRNAWGYDHYAFHAIIRQLGPIKTLALGQYKVKFGRGLVINNGFAFGKLTSEAALSLPSYSITPNTSRNESRYMQGAAATLALSKRLSLTVFASHRRIDATIKGDSIRTILTTGYHRTPSELERKHNATQTAAGMDLMWRKGGFHAGIDGLYTRYDKPLAPDVSQPYRRYYPSGRDFLNASVYYGYTHSRFTIGGETAVNGNGALATLNSLSLRPASSLTLTAVQRMYSYRYHSPFASAFSDGGKVQNESGFYLGVSWQMSSSCSLTAYSDYAYHPWLRYRVSKDSHSWDNLVQTSLTLGSCTLSARYRLRLRQQDRTLEDGTRLLADNTAEHRARLSLTCQGTRLTMKTSVDGVSLPQLSSHGLMVSQTAAYTCGALSASLLLAWFDTTDYDSRIYTYTRNPIYSFSFPSFYGNGIHASLFLKASITKWWTLSLKADHTKYFDRNHISSSLQRIDSSAKTDLELTTRLTF